MYTEENIPNLKCRDCKFYKANADKEQSLCKRIDHKTIKFAKPWFKADVCGENHIICRDFEPKHPEYADFKEWTSTDDYLKQYFKYWWTKPMKISTVEFVLNDDFKVRYKVPLIGFLNGTMIKDNKLMATEKVYYKQSRSSPIGHELIHEPINGININ